MKVYLISFRGTHETESIILAVFKERAAAEIFARQLQSTTIWKVAVLTYELII